MVKDYKDGKVYKIVCRVTGETYVGSTAEKLLSQRLARHKRHLTEFKKGGGSNVSSFPILERGDYYIELIEKFPCDTVEQLKQRERYWYDQIDCVNKIRPHVSKEEYKELRKQYAEDNKERITQYKKEWRETHYEPSFGQAVQKLFTEEEEIQEKLSAQKEYQQQYQSQYRKEHKEFFQQYDKQYYENHKEKIKERSASWYKDNHDRAIQQRREYHSKIKDERNQKLKEEYQNNEKYREHIMKKSSEYYYANKDKKETCGCGKEYSVVNKLAHLRTTHHKKWESGTLDEIKEGEVRCGCGKIMKKQTMWKHAKSEFHKQWLKSQ